MRENGSHTEQPPDARQETQPASPWVTRSDVLGTLALAVIFMVGVGVIGLRQATVGDDVKVIHSGSEAATYRIDLNNAPTGELVLLPGIGHKRAERIVNRHRDQGPFKNYDEVRKATGMSKKQFNALLDMVTLGSKTGNLE